jgi:hypothetical protein
MFAIYLRNLAAIDMIKARIKRMTARTCAKTLEHHATSLIQINALPTRGPSDASY